MSDIVIVKDKNLTTIFMNRAFENFFNIKLETIDDVKTNKTFLSFRNQNSAIDEIVKSSMKELKELVIVKSRKQEETYFEVIKTPILDRDNNFNGLISIFRDITERIILEKELKRSEEKYRTFVSNSSELIACFELKEPIDMSLPIDQQIILIGNNAVLVECNQAFIENHGYETFIEIKESSLGKFLPLIFEANREKLKEFIQNSYLLKNFESCELKKDGSVAYYLVSMNGIIENQKLVRIWKVKKDITEIKKLNLELEQRVRERTRELELLNKELESFNYSVSHDLKAPLRAIAGFSQLILEEYQNKLDSEILNYINNIFQNGLKLQTLIDDILKLSKISITKLQLYKFSLQELITEIVDEFKNRGEVGRTEFIFYDLPEIYADRSLMKLAFSNLISNAIKFAAKVENPTVEIGSLLNDDQIEIFVKDNGIGYDKKYKSKLFAPFQRIHSEQEFPGTGIGLSIVKRVIERHNGTIDSESELGMGTTFIIKFNRKQIEG